MGLLKRKNSEPSKPIEPTKLKQFSFEDLYSFMDTHLLEAHHHLSEYRKVDPLAKKAMLEWLDRDIESIKLGCQELLSRLQY
jgi:hypothetical protein